MLKKVTPLLVVVCLVLSACTTTPANQNEHYLAAQKHKDNYEYSKAVEEYKLAENEVPQLTESYTEAADILILKGKFDDATVILTTGSTAAQDKSAIFAKLGEVALLQGKFDKADTYFDQALQIKGDSQLALAGKAKSLAAQNQTDKLKQFLQGIPTSAVNQELMIDKGLSVVDTPSEASAQFQQAEQGSNADMVTLAKTLDADSTKLGSAEEGLFSLAQMTFNLLDKGWYEAAYPLSQLLIQKNQYYEQGYLYQGIIQLHFGDADKAAASFDKTLTLNSKAVNAYLLSAQAYFQLAKPDQALAMADKAEKLLPATDAALASQLLELLVDNNQNEKAYVFFSSYVKTPGTAEGKLLFLGLKSALAINRAAEAKQLASVLLTKIDTLTGGDQAWAYALVGYTDFQNGEKSKGLSEIKKAETLDRSLSESFYYEGLILIDQKNFTDAKTALEKAIDTDVTGTIAKLASQALKQL